ncbi:ankyrin repeat domain-containing protein, partial [Candidatus Dependentiae bacterium]
SITMLLAVFSANMFAGKIHDAVIDGNIKTVTQLIEENQNVVNKADNDGFTPLYWACENNNLEIVELLLPHCTKETINKATNKATNDGPTPLWWACCKNSLEIVKLLLPHCTKATINKADKYNNGWTPLHIACYKKNPETIELLVLNGATVRQEDIVDSDQTLKYYLEAALEYDALEKNKLQDKIKFIYSKSGEQVLFNLLIKLAFSRSAEEVIGENEKFLSFISPSKLFAEKNWKDTVFCEIYKDKTIDFQKILGVPRQDNYVDFVNQVIKKNDFYFAKPFVKNDLAFQQNLITPNYSDAEILFN